VTRPLTLFSVLLLLASLLGAGPADARRGFGGFGGGRPSFSRPSVRPPMTFSRPRPAAPPVIAPAPAPSLPSTGGFGSGRARGVVGAPGAPAVPPSVPAAGAFGGGDARGVAGATAKKPISSRPTAAAPPSGAPGGAISSAPPRPAPSPGNVYRDFRRVEPVRGSPNVYVYDRRPGWGFIPFWWFPPIYTPTGTLVSSGGANPFGIFLSLAVMAAAVVLVVALLRRR